jgi:hypothetical protein
MIQYPEGFDASNITHVVGLHELHDGDLIPANTVIIVYWPMWGNC